MVIKILLAIFLGIFPIYAATVYTNDFISLAERTNFHSFESTSGNTQTWDGIKVTAINTDASGISSYLLADGSRSWYHDGGDYGYVSITMLNGTDFNKIGVYVSNGWGGATSGIYYNYQLVNNGAVVQSGNILATNMPDPGVVNFKYLGFYANGTIFDEVRLSSTNGSAQSVTSGAYQAICIDAIEVVGTVPVPEPSSLVLLFCSALILFIRRK